MKRNATLIGMVLVLVTTGCGILPVAPSRAAQISPTPTSIQGVNASSVYALDLRAGPAEVVSVSGQLPPDSVVTIFLRTEDMTWIKIRSGGVVGWIETKLLTEQPDLTRIPIVSTEELRALSANACVAVVGDSVSMGDVIIEIPTVGFGKLRTHRISKFIAEHILRNNLGLAIVDRSVAATSISTSATGSYFYTWDYSRLLDDRCKFTIITPWINDLGAEIEPRRQVALHEAVIARIVQQLVERNPNGRILLLNYYDRVKFGRQLDRDAGLGFTRESVRIYNAALAKLCTTGTLAIRQVTCINTQAIFSKLGFTYAAGPITREEAQRISTEKDDLEGNELAYYWRIHPNGPIYGDGVHLSEAGKAALAQYLVGLMRTLPDLEPQR